MSGPARTAGALALLSLLAPALPACTGALWSVADYRSGPERAAAPPAGPAPATKAEVLARLGPPSEIRPLETGDLFLYRLQRTRREILDINTRLVGVGGVTLYADIDGLVVDRVLYVRFDGAGRVVDYTATGTP